MLNPFQPKGKMVRYNNTFRGPLICVFAASLLLVPIINAIANLRVLSLAALIALSIGLSLFIYDTLLLLKINIITLRTTVLHTVNDVVLDDVLKGLFSIEHGLVGCLIGTMVGSAGMCIVYNLPLSKEQRVSLARSYFPNINVEDILTNPGGLKSLLPKNILTNIPSQISVESLMSTPNDSSSLVSDNYLERECETNTSPSVDLTYEDEQSCSEGDSVETISGSLGIGPIDESRKFQNKRTPIVNDLIRIPPSIKRGNDTKTTFWTLVVGVVTDLAAKELKNLNLCSAKKIGIFASFFLLVQLKGSRVARRILLGILHGSLSIGATGVATIAIATTLATTPKSMHIVESQNLLRGHKYYKSNGFFNPIVSSVLKSMQTIQKFNTTTGESSSSHKKFFSRWKSTVAVIVMLYLGQRLKRKIK